MSGSRFSFLATDPNSYEHFMGRWSARLANPFLNFAAIQPGTRVLDLGCGTGVLSVALAERGCTVVGIDASEAYLDGARRHRSHPLVTYEVGDGQRLSHADGSFDNCVSTLAIDVVPEIESFAAEMRRVTRPGGVVASGTFDFWGGFSASELVLDTGAVFDEALRERRDYLRSRPLLWPNGQAGLWRKVGLIDVVEVPIVMSFDYQSFEDYWTSLATGPTGMAQRLQMLPSEIRDEICRHVRFGYLAGMPDGPRSFAGIIRAVRGLVPN